MMIFVSNRIKSYSKYPAVMNFQDFYKRLVCQISNQCFILRWNFQAEKSLWKIKPKSKKMQGIFLKMTAVFCPQMLLQSK